VLKHRTLLQHIYFIGVLSFFIVFGSNLAQDLSTSLVVPKTLSLSRVLKNMQSNKQDVVVSTKLLEFSENIDNAWNGSILEKDNGYVLVFRHDTLEKWCTKCGLTKQQIKMVFLDRDFQQVTPIKTIFSDRFTAEDVRMHYWKDQIFLTYNDDDLQGHTDPWTRRMYLAKLDIDNTCLTDIKQIPSGGISVKPIEKNWTPFEYPEHGGSLYYIYSISGVNGIPAPYSIIATDWEETPVSIHHTLSVSQNIDRIWNKDFWGEIRGGSPARLVDDVYLTFFHSWKYSPRSKSYYYVMGAYTFQAQPPFKILAMTPKPIVFKEMYSGKHKVKNVHTLYPAGFAIEKKDDKTLLHVSCGENDLCVRIVSIDKDALLKSMVRL
jgi:predicted GH43/DUF377 family glycosyl hydrolase